MHWFGTMIKLTLECVFMNMGTALGQTCFGMTLFSLQCEALYQSLFRFWLKFFHNLMTLSMFILLFLASKFSQPWNFFSTILWFFRSKEGINQFVIYHCVFYCSRVTVSNIVTKPCQHSHTIKISMLTLLQISIPIIMQIWYDIFSFQIKIFCPFFVLYQVYWERYLKIPLFAFYGVCSFPT